MDLIRCGQEMAGRQHSAMTGAPVAALGETPLVRGSETMFSHCPLCPLSATGFSVKAQLGTVKKLVAQFFEMSARFKRHSEKLRNLLIYSSLPTLLFTAFLVLDTPPLAAK